MIGFVSVACLASAQSGFKSSCLDLFGEPEFESNSANAKLNKPADI